MLIYHCNVCSVRVAEILNVTYIMWVQICLSQMFDMPLFIIMLTTRFMCNFKEAEVLAGLFQLFLTMHA